MSNRRMTMPLSAVLALLAVMATGATGFKVRTLLGTGVPGFSETQINNPYGVVIGPDGALYFCDLDNQRVRRFDLKTGRTAVIAGRGERGHSGDGGPSTEAALNMPHEIRFDAQGDLFIAERDSHVVRKVDMRSHIITTVAGTGVAGFDGDGGPATRARLRQPHSIAFDRDGTLLICDIGNLRIRRVNVRTGIISTYAGTGQSAATPDGAPVRGTPLRGPRTIEVAPNGDLFIALREGNAIYRVDASTQTLHHIAGTGEQGYSGDGGLALKAKLGGPKGLSLSPDGFLYVADTENHAIRRINLATGLIETVLGTGVRGNVADGEPLTLPLSRPHGIFATHAAVFVSDSESHRIRVLE
jgi:sugar lactone lactonase YvrE